ncbi:MAG: hypothetical protein IT546_09710 [Caulobacteraceae bacterium]|jgi:hypothetical protein|nr:hypothetical protein [Caulobacteraceae bacterium]
MTLHESPPRLAGAAAEARLARMRKRLREVSRRASKAAHGRRPDRARTPLLALLFCAACIGAAAFELAETLLRRAFWP